MEFPYTFGFAETGTIAVPILKIILYHNNKSYPTEAIVDSSAYKTAINFKIANKLGIDLSQLHRTIDPGMGGDVISYHTELDLEIIKIPDSKRHIKMCFVQRDDDKNFLGGIGFFDNFKVTFEKYNNKFEIELINA